MQWWEEKAYAREEGYEEGHEEGHKEGYKEGHEEGHEEGHMEGYAEGEEKRLIRTICKKLKKQKSLEAIADDVEESLELVTKISDVAEAFAPGYDCDEIYEKLHESEEGCWQAFRN